MTPSLLYKYVTAERALACLPEVGDGALRATQPTALNDPFECHVVKTFVERDRAEGNEKRNCLAGPKPQKQGLRQRRLDKTRRLGYRSVDASVRPDRGGTGQRPEDRGQQAATRHQAEGRGGCASGAESGAPPPGAGPTQAGTGHGAAGAEAPGGAVLQGPAAIAPSATRPEGRAQVRAEAAPEGPGAGGQRGRCAAAGGRPDVSRGDRARAGRGPRPGRVSSGAST